LQLKDIVDPDDLKTTYRVEKEIAVPHAIKPQDIKGAWSIKVTPPLYPDDSFTTNSDYGRELQKPFIQNPRYESPKRIKVKLLGHTLTGVGLALDGFDVYQAFKKGAQTQDYHGAYRKVSEVAGGWSAAFPAATIGAQVGMALCAPILPPFGSGVCGLIGGIRGGWLGYESGREIGGLIYDSSSRSTRSVESSANKLNASDDHTQQHSSFLLFSREFNAISRNSYNPLFFAPKGAVQPIEPLSSNQLKR